MTDHAPLRIERRGAAAHVVLADARRRNPLGTATLDALAAELAALGTDPDVRAVVIAADGPAFSAGHDLSEMRDRDDAFYEDLFGRCVEVMTLLHRIPQPVVAKVDGVATAAGCQLVASCDLAVASRRATFATPGVRIGLFCSTPMVPIARAVGPKRAMELLLTGDPIDAATALEWGLVNRVVAPEELDAAVDDLVESIVRWSGATIAIGKEAFYHQLGRTEDDAYSFTAGVMAANAVHGDAREGIAAFCDKRSPRWSDQR